MKKNNQNSHSLIYGGSEYDKRFYVKLPNLYQMNSSYVLVDPGGKLYAETEVLFEKSGYQLKVLDILHFENSMHYNPFVYIFHPQDIFTLAKTLLINLKPSKDGEDFWDHVVLLWLQSVIGYLWYESSLEEQNISMMIKFLELDAIREDDEEFKNAVDMLFDELEERDPNHFAVKQRKKYKMAAGKRKDIALAILSNMFSKFDIPGMLEMMEHDELQIDTYGNKEQKTILYVIISDIDKSYNFIPAIMLTQMFNVLCYKAEEQMEGKLETPVRFILEKFGKIGKIPDFDVLMAIMGSRSIYCDLFIQTRKELESQYKDEADVIMDICDRKFYLF